MNKDDSAYDYNDDLWIDEYIDPVESLEDAYNRDSDDLNTEYFDEDKYDDLGRRAEIINRTLYAKERKEFIFNNGKKERELVNHIRNKQVNPDIENRYEELLITK